MSLTGLCDADWASDLDDRRSTSDASIFGGPRNKHWLPNPVLKQNTGAKLKLLLKFYGYSLSSKS